MLQKLRDKTSGWIATAILGLLMIPFAFFGMEQYLFQSNQTFVARVETPPSWWQAAPSWWPATLLWQREEIDVEQFRSAFEQARQQQRAAQGEGFDPREFESLESKRQTLDTLIDQTVLQLAAADTGIGISDTQVRDAIQAIPAFQVDGKFDAQRYQLALASQNPPLSPRGFEQQVRESLQQALMSTQIAQSAFVTPAEMQRLMQLLGERRDVAFATLPPPAADTAPVSDADAQAWYASHARDYRMAEMVTIEYVDIDGSTLPLPPSNDEAVLRARYEQEKARFVEPEQRLTSHILVTVPSDADTATQQAAEAKATKLAADAKQPGAAPGSGAAASFAALARANSDDTGSKASGGDLGWVEKGAMVAPFEQALFAMQPGEIRGPVKSEFGWHVIQLRELKTGRQTTFEEARAELEKEQGESGRERAVNDLVGKLVDQVLKNPTSLAQAARSVNLPVQKLGPFARGQGGGIASNLNVIRAAFSDTLIEDSTVSDPIEIAPNHSVLIRVAQHSPERAQPLAQITGRVVADVRADRAAKAAAADADAIVAKLRGGESLATLASARGVAAQDVPNVPRGAPVPEAAASRAFFEVPAPAAGKLSPGKATLADGRIVVFAVSKVTTGDPAETTPEQRTQLEQQIAQVSGAQDAQAMLQALRKRMNITVTEERL
ncbi:MAG: SurA N-terminal domain-containing protein [Luteimonas sp.]